MKQSESNRCRTIPEQEPVTPSEGKKSVMSDNLRAWVKGKALEAINDEVPYDLEDPEERMKYILEVALEGLPFMLDALNIKDGTTDREDRTN